MTAWQIQNDEETEIREAIRGIRLPSGVRFNRVVLANDWDGDPSWEIYFDLPKRLKPTEKFLDSLQEVREKVRGAVFYVATDKFPYIHFKQAA